MNSESFELESFELPPEAVVDVHGSILRMARAWQAAGHVNEAIHTYTELLTRYPGTFVAQEAAEELHLLAQSYEKQGKYHLARSLYEKLQPPARSNPRE